MGFHIRDSFARSGKAMPADDVKRIHYDPGPLGASATDNGW